MEHLQIPHSAEWEVFWLWGLPRNNLADGLSDSSAMVADSFDIEFPHNKNMMCGIVCWRFKIYNCFRPNWLNENSFILILLLF